MLRQPIASGEIGEIREIASIGEAEKTESSLKCWGYLLLCFAVRVSNLIFQPEEGRGRKLAAFSCL